MKIDEFDSHPFLVNFKNCTLDFEQMQGELPKVKQHCQSDYLTKCLPYDYNEGAPAHLWESVIEHAIPNPATRRFLQKSLGYSVLGTCREQCAFIAYGPPATCKSTVFGTVLRLLGPYGSRCATQALLEKPVNGGASPDIADQRGVRFLLASETPENGRLNESLFKELTGQDRIRARPLYKQSIEFEATGKLWILTNHKPVIRDTTGAVWRRIRLIPFDVVIPKKERDKTLPDRLSRESEGILRWLVEGACMYMKEGLEPPEQVEVETDKYREQQDTIGRFISECTIQEQYKQVSKTALYEEYERWSRDSGEYAVNKKKFGEYLFEHGFDDYKGTAGKRFWLNIGLMA